MPATSSRPAAPVRRRARAAMAMVVLGGAVLVASGCSTPSPGRGEIVEALVASGLPEDASACAADALLDELSDQELAELVERGGGGLPTDDPQRTDDTMDQLRNAMTACRELVDPTTTTTAPAEGATTTTVAPDDGGAGGGAVIDSTPTTAAS